MNEVTALPGWALAPGQSLVADDYDSEVVLFDRLSGSTHLVNATAAIALDLIRDNPGLTATDLHDRLTAYFDVSTDELPLPAIDTLLAHLESLGLVRQRRG